MDLSSRVAEKQARVVCIPYPAQSHIKAMLKMAKLLHSKNIFITVVNTEFNHKRFLKSRGLQSLDGLPSFRFETIPDGLPPSHVGATQEIPALNYSIKENNMLPPFQSLLEKLNAATYPVTSILSDGFMTFTADAAHSPGCPIVLLWTIAACGLMGFYQFKNVLDRGLVPFKVMSEEQLLEFGWGVANSKCSFLWIIVEDVLNQSSVGGFLTHAWRVELDHREHISWSADALLAFLWRSTNKLFETIPDGLPPSDADKTQDVPQLLKSIFEKKMLPPFQNLLTELNAGMHQVTSILSDGFMPFTADAAHSLGIPIVLLWTISACGFMGFYQFKNVRDRGLVPLKDESYLTNGYLDTTMDWIPGMRDIRLVDLPSHVRIIDPNDTLFDYFVECFQSVANCTALVLHTFDDWEQELVKAISSMFKGAVYTIGPLQLLVDQVPINQKDGCNNTGYSLWEEEKTCLQWLDSREADSVVYVNFGSITVISAEQLLEFGWGLANSNCCFLWIIRPDLVVGESTVTLGVEFLDAIKDRGLISSWCAQEDVLNHSSVGGFLTHGGWNSIIESISAGVPMLCWPFFGDQTINCKFLSDEWECGLKIPNNVKRDDVEKLVKLLMVGKEGKKMRNKTKEWKKMAEKACAPDGSSSLNMERLVLLLKN
ncbi:hypothetical protein AgCh_028044 [Apium graveolens]